MATSLTDSRQPPAAADLQRLAVFLNGERDYVQGTQMIARAAEAWAPQLGPRAVLTSAAFRKITQNKILCLGGDTPPPEGLALIGEASFAAQPGGSRQATTLRFAELAEPAERQLLAETIVYQPLAALQPGLAGDFAFAGLKSFEDLLILIVQSVKAVHEAAGPEIHDIWFTGCRQTALPLGAPSMTAGKLTVKHLRLLGRAPLFQTMSAVELEGAGGGNLSAVVTFAFQAGAFELER